VKIMATYVKIIYKIKMLLRVRTKYCILLKSRKCMRFK
jgi:hypothetical protein